MTKRFKLDEVYGPLQERIITDGLAKDCVDKHGMFKLNIPKKIYNENAKIKKCRIRHTNYDFTSFDVIRSNLNNHVRMKYFSRSGIVHYNYTSDITLVNYAIREIYFNFINPHAKKILYLIITKRIPVDICYTINDFIF